MGDPSEFSHGSGLQPPQSRGYVPTAYDRLLATRLTDPANPNASESAILEGNVSVSTVDADGRYVPGDQRSGTTPRVVETGPAPATGQHTPVDPSTYNKGHDPEGLQDGEGEQWRATIPGPPITDDYRGENPY